MKTKSPRTSTRPDAKAIARAHLAATRRPRLSGEAFLAPAAVTPPAPALAAWPTLMVEAVERLRDQALYPWNPAALDALRPLLPAALVDVGASRHMLVSIDGLPIAHPGARPLRNVALVRSEVVAEVAPRLEWVDARRLALFRHYPATFAEARAVMTKMASFLGMCGSCRLPAADCSRVHAAQ